MNSLTITLEQLCALSDLLLGLAHADGDFDFLEAGEINDVLTDLIDGSVPLEVSRHMALFDAETFKMKEACEIIIDQDVDSNGVVNLLIQIANADSVFDISEHEYIAEVADFLGAPLEDLEEGQIELIEVTPPPLPT